MISTKVNKNFLFFFVHPSKFHVFRSTINYLIQNGHRVDILITSKDILEELVKEEGWDYTNIFPEGRKMTNIPALFSAGINIIRTIYRLFKYTKGKKYDLFITDDLLVYIGKIKKIPSIVFIDDDLEIVKSFSIILAMADHCLSPIITNLGKYNKKKIGFNGYKELAYLHPDEFEPNIDIIKKINPNLSPYYIIRLVSLNAYHDFGKNGLSNDNVKKLISVLEKNGMVFISAERPLPPELKRYKLSIQPNHIKHLLYYAQLFIGDSQTMCSEAAVLGTPTFRCNDFFGKISVMDEKEEIYNLSFNYPSTEFDKMLNKIIHFVSLKNIKNDFKIKRATMLKDKINLSAFMKWFFEYYPKSVKEFRSNPNIQDRYL